MSDREWLLLIDDILESINKIERYVSKMDFDEFVKDDKTIDAVIRNFGIIGEAAHKIPITIKDKYYKVEWAKIIGLRNRVIHDYFGVDLEIIWFIVKNEIEVLEKEIKEIK